MNDVFTIKIELDRELMETHTQLVAYRQSIAQAYRLYKHESFQRIEEVIKEEIEKLKSDIGSKVLKLAVNDD